MKAEQLRKSILQLAIQGKLVKQDPNDEPASVLLERIRAEKQRLIKEGKIKKDKGDSIIFKGDDNCHYEKIGSEIKNINDEIPFEIPDSWCWVRHNDIIEIFGGSQPPKSKFITEERAGYVRLYQIRDYGPNPAPVYIPIETAHKTTEQGDILLARYGASVGKVFWAENGAYNVAMAKVEKLYIGNHILEEYLYLFYKAPLYQTLVLNNSRSAQAGFNKDDLDSLFIPVPPLAEQERIISHIKQFEPLLAEYDKLEQQATKLDNEIYDKLKKSVLQYAMQGKLVPQDSNEEPASVLLERIRAEKKAQLGRKYVESYIYKGDDNCYYEHIGEKDVNITEEIPFDLPDGWEWSRLNSIINVVSARRVHQSDWKDRGIPFYRAREIAQLANFGKVNNELYISQELFDIYKLSGIPLPGDLMVTAVGTIGKTYIVKPNDKFYYKDASVICFENHYKCNPLWLKSLMDAPYMVEQIRSASAGTTVDTITIEKANKYLIPLPPLAEQKRIVDKINEMFAKL